MKYSITKYLIAALVACATTACGSVVIVKTKDVKEHKYDSSKFQNISGIVSMSSVDIHYVQGPLEIKLVAPDAIVPYVNLERANDDLVVTVKNSPDGFTAISNVTLVVSAPEVNRIISRGSADISVEKVRMLSNFCVTSQGSGDVAITDLDCNQLEINTQGSGDVIASGLQCKTVSAETMGSGDIILSGQAGMLKTVSMGSGDIIVSDMKYDNVTAISRGSGDIIK